MYHHPYSYSHRSLPCFHCHPDAYIRMVQHLIERCLVVHMSRDECVKALAHHANIRPLITLTVWKELQKENTEFFRAYNFHAISRPNPLFLGKFTRNAPRTRIMRRRRQYYWR